jgi:protein RecA
MPSTRLIQNMVRPSRINLNWLDWNQTHDTRFISIVVVMSVKAASLGVDIDNLLVSQPDSAEMALHIVDQLVRSSAVDVIVVDSVAALVPRAELEGDMSDTQIGLQARLMSKAMRKITGSLALSQCTVIFLNQLRSKVRCQERPVSHSNERDETDLKLLILSLIY